MRKRELESGTESTLAASACATLREEIISGRLGPGEPLRFDGLRRQFGISVSPLREALAILVSERLVCQESQKGFRVAPISWADLQDLTDRRLQLEIHALGQSIAQGDEDWEVRVLGAQHRLSRISERILNAEAGLGEEWESKHRTLHLSLISACSSPWLLHFCAQLYDHFDRYRRLAGREERTAEAIVANPEAPVVELALARDAAGSCALLNQHIGATVEDIRAALFPDT